MDPTTGDTIGVMDNGSHDVESGASYLFSAFLTKVAAFGFGVVSGLTITNLAGDIKEFLLTTAIGNFVSEKAKVVAEIYFAINTVLEALKAGAESDPTLAIFYAGVTVGVAIGKANLRLDPPTPPILLSLAGSSSPATNQGTGSETVLCNSPRRSRCGRRCDTRHPGLGHSVG